MRGRPRSRAPWTLIGALALLSGFEVSGAVAQEDFRSADLDRPILTEDAIPLKLGEWETEIGARGALAEAGSALTALFELKAGLFRNGQVGLEVETAVERAEAAGDGTGTEAGIEAFGAHVFYALSRETTSLPAFAIRLDARTPGIGEVGHEAVQAGVKGIATRSFDRLRVHANAGYVVADSADGGDYWRAGLGFDYPIGLFSKSVLGDIYAELPTHSGRARVWAEVGTRWQLSNTRVLDLGIASRLDEWEAGDPNVELVVGLSTVFGWASLRGVPRYPDPSIRD